MTTFYRSHEPIAALATAPGEGGIAIVRLSGIGVVDIADKVFSGSVTSYQSHTVHLGYVKSEDKVIDQALLIVMRAPRSYTGEDVIEFHCHGGMLVSQQVLRTLLSAGARLAQPGEFTFRAFMNGKIDLSQAEAVQALIGAKSKCALEYAESHLAGVLSKKIANLQEGLLQLAAILEAWVDFPEEDIEFATKEQIQKLLQASAQDMQKLISTFEDGKKIFCGISLAIVGEPNVGKSSLLNALIEEERAIVTPIAGTTRDLLHEEVTIAGVLFKLTDTAGIRETDDLIEKEGIRLARRTIEHADWILAVCDLTRQLPSLIHQLPLDKTIIVFNKADISAVVPFLDAPHQVVLSAKTKDGIENLKEYLKTVVLNKHMPDQQELILSNNRHKELLLQAMQAVQTVDSGLKQNISPEWLLVDLRLALHSLGEILGQDVTDEVLTKIFSTFCIGK